GGSRYARPCARKTPALIGRNQYAPCRLSFDSPYQQAASWRFEAAACQPDQRGGDAGGHETVEPVHQPTMPRDKSARVLGAELALEEGFEQIAALRENRQDDCERGDREQGGQRRRLGNRERGDDRGDGAADRPRPGLLRA